jgi:hypothetical protein
MDMGYLGRRDDSFADETQPPSDRPSIPPIVVIADDRDARRETCARELEDNGIWTISALTPEQTVTAIAELKPDVVATIAHFVIGSDGSAALANALRHLTRTHRARSILFDAPIGSHLDGHVAIAPETSSAMLAATVEEVLREQAGNRGPTTLQAQRTSRRDRVFPRAVTAPAAAARRCPACSRPLVYIETGRIGGVLYEYFHWCEGGCGLYCFDRDAGRFVKLA